jgi:predicted HAD superfamily Cof-like phosphohydrolase
MKSTDDLVREFHEFPGSKQPVRDYPDLYPSADLIRHRMRLIEEEFKEVMDELHSLLANGMLPETSLAAQARLLKEMCDLRYVLDGTAVSLGLPYEAAYREVHASNMTKAFPDGLLHTDERGKVLKGPDYRPPDMSVLMPMPVAAEVLDVSEPVDG